MSERERPVSALPSVQARVLAFMAILVAGVSGGAIGWGVTRVLAGRRTEVGVLVCDGSCPTIAGAGGLFGAALAAGGVAIIAVLVLRAMGEWNQGQPR